MIALVIICDFASLRTCTECHMPDWLPWGNVGLRDCSRRHVLRGNPLIGHWSVDASDGVAGVNVILLLRDAIGELCYNIGLVLVTHKCWDYDI